MISRLAKLAMGALLCFSLGTLIAEGIIVGYVWSKWHLNREKIARLVDVARGIEQQSAGGPAPSKVDEPGPEQPSFDQVIEARAVKDKNLQLREQALASALAELQAEQDKLAGREKQFKLDRTDYETKLAAAAQNAKASGQEEVRRIFQTIKPKQAKELLQSMLDNKEQDEVVALLSGMTDSKRAKILAEFKTSDETKKIEEVLRQIRKGVPEAPLAQQALDQARPASVMRP
jgi:flagellar motility protein MotE (MotC chaperone)